MLILRIILSNMNNEKPRRRPRGLSFQSYDDLQHQPEKHDQPIPCPNTNSSKASISLIDELQASILHDEPPHVDITSADQQIRLDDQPLACDTEHSSAPSRQSQLRTPG